MSVLNRLILSVLLGATLALPAVAASSLASTSSEGSSASVGSLSDSIQGSSNSSSGTKVAEGPYRVIEVAALPDGGTGRTRVTLAAVQGAQTFVLLLPAAAATQAQLAAGDIVQVRERGYGLQFARADAREPFFLVLDDASWRELKSRPVAL
jgi:hypothetical protein